MRVCGCVCVCVCLTFLCCVWCFFRSDGTDLPVQHRAVDGDRQVAPRGKLRPLPRGPAVRAHPVRQGQSAPVDPPQPRDSGHPEPVHNGGLFSDEHATGVRLAICVDFACLGYWLRSLLRQGEGGNRSFVFVLFLYCCTCTRTACCGYSTAARVFGIMK